MYIYTYIHIHIYIAADHPTWLLLSRGLDHYETVRRIYISLYNIYMYILCVLRVTLQVGLGIDPTFGSEEGGGGARFFNSFSLFCIIRLLFA